MTRKRFERLTRALSIHIGKQLGCTVTGQMIFKQRKVAAKSALDMYGTYAAAWEAMGDIRKTFGFK